MESKAVTIKDKIINSEKIFITAEVGVTCNYDMTIAKKLIKVVANAGADAIKFIFWFPDEIMSDKKTIYSYNTIHGLVNENMYDMLNKLRFSFNEWQELKAYADECNVLLFSTINSPSGIEYARKLNLDAYKLSSWDFNYIDLWEELAKDQKPFIIDTGPVHKEELDVVFDILKKYDTPAVLVHCFHTKSHSEINMRTIPFLKKTYNTPVGFSATDTSMECDLLAIGLGANFIEKRLTLSRALPGHHHILSLEPKEFIKYVKTIKNAHKSLGSTNIIPSQDDLTEKKKFFRSIVAAKPIKAGTIITRDLFLAKRPGTGIPPKTINLLIGKKILQDLNENELLEWKHIDSP